MVWIRRAPFVSATLFYTALAFALTFPLVLHLNSVVPSDIGDPLLSTSILWWNAHAFPLTERWWNGFAFAPARGMIAFSDHRLGMSLIATPLQWLGCSPLTAYNILFLSTFPLCALGGHIFGYTLTRRHDAAAICGLAYGFNPFRIAHLSHIELLAAFAMPAALAALHMYLCERRTKWILLFALALVIQGLCGTYYLLFFGVMLSLWLLWFARDWQTLALVGAASACGGGLLLPIVVGYQRIHAFHGFSRLPGEVASYGADFASFVTAWPLLRVWGFTSSFTAGQERELFPGLTIVVLAVAGLVVAIRRRPPAGNSWQRTSGALLLAACVAAATSLAFDFSGAWSIQAAGLRFRVTDAYKPASIALLLLTAGIAFQPSVRGAWRRRSLLAFYLTATAFLFLCSMGPVPTFLGEQVLYKPPYEWLMMALPMVARSVRVPARFAMPAILALAAAAALGFDRFNVSRSTRRAIAVAALAGIVADGWIRRLDLLPPPGMWPVPAHYDFGSVVELPLAQDFGDFAAMYRGTMHGHPVVNGQSGFFPVHYLALQMSLNEGNPRGLDAFAQPKPLLVVIDRHADAGGRWSRMVALAEHSALVARDERWEMYGISPPAVAGCDAGNLEPVSVSDATGPIDVRVLRDHDLTTAWSTHGPQQFNDTLQIDLGHPSRLCELRLSLGTEWPTYPRDMDVTTSADAVTWTRRFKGSPAGLVVRGAIDDPHNIWMTVPLHAGAARFIRLRLDAGHPTAPWFIPELRVTGS